MIQDIRYGVRTLLRQPGFSVVTLLTLALGIGVTTALFTVFNALVLKPLPLKDVDSIVVAHTVPLPGQRARNFSYPDYQDYVARAQTFAGLALITEGGAAMDAEQFNQREDFGLVKYQLVTANYFSLFGAEMTLGRGFLPEENRTPGTHAVAVLSHYFWERAFKSNPNIIGQTIRLAGQPFTVVGVTAKEFVGTAPNRPACWVPLMMRDALFGAAPTAAASWQHDRNAAGFGLWGRLKPGVTAAQAQAELTTLTEQLARDFPGENRQVGLQLKRAPGFASEGADEEVQQMFLILPLSVALVLLIACANVANLLLARAAKRQKEIATRQALGASRARIIRQLLTESVLLATAGGALGLLLAWWSLSVLYPLVLSQFPVSAGSFVASMALNLEPDYRVFGFTLLMALLAGVTAGLAPALQVSRPNLTNALKGEGSVLGEHLSQSRLRNGLIVMQLAFSLVLLVSAGLLVRNLQKLQTIDTGFETARLFAAEVALDYTRAQQTETLREQLATRLRAMPEVEAVSRTSRAPLSGQAPPTLIALPGQTDRQHLTKARFDFVSPSHLATLGVALVSGRNFTEQEANSNARVAVISAATVRKLWPQFTDASQALGQSIGIAAGDLRPEANDETPATYPVYQVIGVTRDTISGMIFQRDGAFLYLPLSPDNSSGEYLLVRTRAEASRVIAMTYTETAALNPNATLAMKPTTEWQSLQNLPFRVAANFALVLGLLALLLAAVGLYGVMSFVVAQRTREIGIRVALGAQPRGILTLFIKQGMRLIAIGIVIGLLGGAAIARLLALILVDLSPFDPLTFGGVALCLMAVALLATWLPARRAARVDPMMALRHD
jgi:predicted permease